MAADFDVAVAITAVQAELANVELVLESDRLDVAGTLSTREYLGRAVHYQTATTTRPPTIARATRPLIKIKLVALGKILAMLRCNRGFHLLRPTCPASK